MRAGVPPEGGPPPLGGASSGRERAGLEDVLGHDPDLGASAARRGAQRVERADRVQRVLGHQVADGSLDELFSTPGETPDPDDVAKMAEAAKAFSDTKVTAATAEIQAWVKENCTSG